MIPPRATYRLQDPQAASAGRRHRQLIALRRSAPALALIANLAPEPRTVLVPIRSLLLSSSSESVVRGDAIELAPDSVVIAEAN